MNCISPLGWHPAIWAACLFICGFCANWILASIYWRKRFAYLAGILDRIQAQQSLVNQFHAGEINKDELAQRLAILYETPWETVH